MFLKKGALLDFFLFALFLKRKILKKFFNLLFIVIPPLYLEIIGIGNFLYENGGNEYK